MQTKLQLQKCRRLTLSISVVVLLSGQFAFAAQSRRAAIREPASQQRKCPPVVVDPKKLKCATKMSYVGQKFSQDIVIALKADDGSNPSGTVEFKYPGVSNGNDEPNTLKATVFTETHGNSPTCQQQQTFEIEVSVLGYKLVGAGRKTTLKIDDGFGFNTFEMDMSCSAE